MKQLSSVALSVHERRQPIANVVADALREAIFNGGLKRGEPLRQDGIAKQFSVSQVSVREALRILAEEGIVEIIPRRGAIVACLSEIDIQEIVELRIMLESMLLAKAMPHLTDYDFTEAERIIKQLDSTYNLNEQLELNVDFHGCLYVRAQRPRTLATLDRLRVALEPYLRMLWLRTQYKFNSQHDHRVILELCRSGDIEGASQALSEHISNTGYEIVKLLRA